MELSQEKITYTLKKQFHQWMAPFLSQPQGYPQPTIMNLLLIEHLLHEHFVSLEPIWITYEYYDGQEQIQEETSLVYVEAPISADRSILLREAYTEESFNIFTEQILSVKTIDSY